MKIIFLDHQGVIYLGKAIWPDGKPILLDFDQESISILNEIQADLKTSVEQEAIKKFTCDSLNRGEQKWNGLSTLTSEPIKPLTADQASSIEEVLKKLSDLYIKPDMIASWSSDIQGITDAKWPMDH
jgi:hypothetical protein